MWQKICILAVNQGVVFDEARTPLDVEELNALEMSNETLAKRSRISEQDTNIATALGF